VTSARFHIEMVDYRHALQDLRSVREAVFIHEQQVAPEEEWDALDPVSSHMLARDEAGQPIGTARLTPEHRIGRMAVLQPWRGRGVGEALLQALIEEARHRQWSELSLHAQVHALDFYSRAGFVPSGPRFDEAGIEHQSMTCSLDGPTLVDGNQAAVAAGLGLLAQARQSIRIYSRALDPGLWDHLSLMKAFRQFAVSSPGREVRILLQDAATPERAHAPLIALAQRLSSVFSFRQVEDPSDLRYPSAYAINDSGGTYFQPLGNRFEGEARFRQPGYAYQLQNSFDPVWERSRPCTEYRMLKI
jgi:predicted GNAT family N-acyltransferase